MFRLAAGWGQPQDQQFRKIFWLKKKNPLLLGIRDSSNMAPPRGLEPRTWWLHLTRNYFRKWTISLPTTLRFGRRVYSLCTFSAKKLGGFSSGLSQNIGTSLN